MNGWKAAERPRSTELEKQVVHPLPLFRNLILGVYMNLCSGYRTTRKNLENYFPQG
jgi:hypothetical protein